MCVFFYAMSFALTYTYMCGKRNKERGKQNEIKFSQLFLREKKKFLSANFKLCNYIYRKKNNEK